AATDHGAEVVGVDADLQPTATAAVDHADAHVLRMRDDALDQVLQRGLEPQVRPVPLTAHQPAPHPRPRPGPRRPPVATPPRPARRRPPPLRPQPSAYSGGRSCARASPRPPRP